jgi:hypothetical protein
MVEDLVVLNQTKHAENDTTAFRPPYKTEAIGLKYSFEDLLLLKLLPLKQSLKIILSVSGIMVEPIYCIFLLFGYLWLVILCIISRD